MWSWHTCQQRADVNDGQLIGRLHVLVLRDAIGRNELRWEMEEW
jgi:hypothetical protein